MFGKDKTPPLKSLIAAGTVIQGDVHFEDGLRIDGEVTGSVLGNAQKPSVLVIGEGAKLCGEVRADHIIVSGEVTGPVTAQRLVELQPKAVVNGDVNYRAIELHLGAMVTGRLCPIADTAPSPAVAPEAMPMLASEASEPNQAGEEPKE